MSVPQKNLNELARAAIESKFMDIRFIQMGRFTSAELFRIIAKVFRETGGEREYAFLFHLIRELKRQDKVEKAEKKAKKSG